MNKQHAKTGESRREQGRAVAADSLEGPPSSHGQSLWLACLTLARELPGNAGSGGQPAMIDSANPSRCKPQRVGKDRMAEGIDAASRQDVKRRGPLLERRITGLRIACAE